MQTYDPGLVKATFGPILLGGYAEGDMIQVNHLGEGNRAGVGTAGEAAYVKDYDQRAEVVFRLMATSPVNALLSGYLQSGNVPVPLIITSLSTGTLHASGDAIIKRQPDVSYSNGVPVREWTFVVAKLETAN